MNIPRFPQAAASCTPPPSRTRIAAAAVMLTLGLSACGGSDSPTSSPAPSPAPTPVPAPSPPPPVPAPTGTPVANDACEAFPSVAGADVNGSLAGSASSPAGRALNFSLVSQPQSGTVTLTSAGVFNYMRSDPGRGNLDSFVYRVTDSEGLRAEATAQVIYGRRRIMPLGDSITDGVETYKPATGDLPAAPMRVGYRKALQKRLDAAGYAVDFVGSQSSGSGAGLADAQHEGYPGAKQAALVTDINSWLGLNAPDVVLLHIGTNDVTGGDTNVAPTSELLSRIDTWSANTANPPVRLLLATIIGQKSGTPDVAAFNANLTSLYNSTWADAAGERPRFVVRRVDMNSKLDPATDLSDLAEDSVGLHPNPSGYAKMADAWFESLVQTGAVFKCPSGS